MNLDEIKQRLEIIISNDAGIAQAILDLDNLLSNNKLCIDKQLVHYLERRSYEKAFKFLNGEPVKG